MECGLKQNKHTELGITVTVSSENGFINIFFCAHLFIDSISTTFTGIMHGEAMATGAFCTDIHTKSTCLNNCTSRPPASIRFGFQI